MCHFSRLWESAAPVNSQQLPCPSPSPGLAPEQELGWPPGTPVHSHSAPLSLGPLPAPSPAGDKEHLSPCACHSHRGW